MKGEKAQPSFDAPLPFDDGDTSRSRKCTRRGHSVPESRIPRQLLIHRGLLSGRLGGRQEGETRARGKERGQEVTKSRGQKRELKI